MCIIKLKIIFFRDKFYYFTNTTSLNSVLLLGLLSRKYLHASIPSVCGMLVYSDATSNDTKIELSDSCGIDFNFFMKSVVSLIYEGSDFMKVCKTLSINLDRFSVYELQPDIMGCPG